MFWMNQGKEPRFGKHVLVVDEEGGGVRPLLCLGVNYHNEINILEVHFEIQFSSALDCSQPSIFSY